MNEHTLIGNLTRDPQIHVAKTSGRFVARFDLAINHRRYDRNTDQWVDSEPVFKAIVAYGPLAENIGESLRRGVEAVVVGREVDDSYEHDGETRRRTVIEAEVVASSLRWALARPMKVDRRPTGDEPAE